MITVTVTHEQTEAHVEWHSAKKLTSAVAKRIANRVFPGKSPVTIDHSEVANDTLIFYGGYEVFDTEDGIKARKI